MNPMVVRSLIVRSVHVYKTGKLALQAWEYIIERQGVAV